MYPPLEAVEKQVPEAAGAADMAGGIADEPKGILQDILEGSVNDGRSLCNLFTGCRILLSGRRSDTVLSDRKGEDFVCPKQYWNS